MFKVFHKMLKEKKQRDTDNPCTDVSWRETGEGEGRGGSSDPQTAPGGPLTQEASPWANSESDVFILN